MGVLYRYLAFLERYVLGHEPDKKYSFSDMIIFLTVVTFLLLPATVIGNAWTWLDENLTVSDQ